MAHTTTVNTDSAHCAEHTSYRATCTGCFKAANPSKHKAAPAASITDHAFTPWKPVPTRCNTCGKVARRHTVATPSVVAEGPRADKAEAMHETTYALLSRAPRQRKARRFCDYVVTTWTDGKLVTSYTYYDYKTGKIMPGGGLVPANVIAGQILKWQAASPYNYVAYTHYECWEYTQARKAATAA